MRIFGLGQPSPPPLPPDLDTQLEDLVVHVLDVERRERMNDRIDSAIRVDEERARRKGRAK